MPKLSIQESETQIEQPLNNPMTTESNNQNTNSQDEHIPSDLFTMIASTEVYISLVEKKEYKILIYTETPRRSEQLQQNSALLKMIFKLYDIQSETIFQEMELSYEILNQESFDYNALKQYAELNINEFIDHMLPMILNIKETEIETITINDFIKKNIHLFSPNLITELFKREIYTQFKLLRKEILHSFGINYNIQSGMLQRATIISRFNKIFKNFIHTYSQKQWNQLDDIGILILIKIIMRLT
ncbi:hypothetical protein AB837_00414 [bacterium AB1]|nr:hypothetical protein AB837_00414 [bacterium AB1]